MKIASSFILLMIVSGLIPMGAGASGVICLLDSTDIKIKNNLTAIVNAYKRFEITSEEGYKYAELAVPVNDYIEIKDIKGYTLLPGGRKIKLEKNDIKVSSSIPAREFGKIQAVLISLRAPAIGAILHYEYNLKIKSLLYLPRITGRASFPSERFAVRIRWDKKVNINYDSRGLEILSSDRTVKFYADDLPEYSEEAYSCPDGIYLFLSADTFSYNKMRFNSRSWPDVGRFFALLADQPDQSVHETERLASRLVRGAESRRDSLEAIFNFVADSVSYVALRIGNGDFNPHTCLDILARRFGDCKDQSVLLSSLYRGTGFDAYPALISTADYPEPMDLHPWPAFFDHAVVVVKEKNRDLILDPSDPYSSVISIPPRLKGKSYIIADGYSGLRVAPTGPDPSVGLGWRFHIVRNRFDTISVDFEISYMNDAARLNFAKFGDVGQEQLISQIETMLRESGWKVSSASIDPLSVDSESLTLSGRFNGSAADIEPDGSIAAGSPLVTYLLDNIFNDIRAGSYCRRGSIHLEEFVQIEKPDDETADMLEYRDYWVREGLEFYDEMRYTDDYIIYRRVFSFAGTELSVEDYNSFRDFILSRRNQRYAPLQK